MNKTKRTAKTNRSGKTITSISVISLGIALIVCIGLIGTVSSENLIYNGNFEIIDPLDSTIPDGWTVELGGRSPIGWPLFKNVLSDVYYSRYRSIIIGLVGGYSNQYCYGIIKSPLINTVQGDLVWYQSQTTVFDASDIEYTIEFYDEDDILVSSNLYYTDTTTSQAGPGCGGGPRDSDMSPPAVIADNGGPACGGGDWYKFSSDIPEIGMDKFRFEIHIYQWEAPNKAGDGDACGSACYAGFDNFYIEPEFVSATIKIDPDTLNLKSHGKWVTGYIELPEGYDVADIDVSTILLEDEILAEAHPTEIGDYDDDAIADLMVKFNRSAVQEMLEVGEDVEIAVTGELTDGTVFEGSDTIRVIDE